MKRKLQAQMRRVGVTGWRYDPHSRCVSIFLPGSWGEQVWSADNYLLHQLEALPKGGGLQAIIEGIVERR